MVQSRGGAPCKRLKALMCKPPHLAQGCGRETAFLEQPELPAKIGIREWKTYPKHSLVPCGSTLRLIKGGWVGGGGVGVGGGREGVGGEEGEDCVVRGGFEEEEKIVGMERRFAGEWWVTEGRGWMTGEMGWKCCCC